jgi:hypothetical protein
MLIILFRLESQEFCISMIRSISFLFLFIILLGVGCTKDKPTTICAQRCSSTTPWRVESLDLDLPCFASKDECLNWAKSHGYGDKPCVECN